jgi:hypothetical protein
MVYTSRRLYARCGSSSVGSGVHVQRARARPPGRGRDAHCCMRGGEGERPRSPGVWYERRGLRSGLFLNVGQVDSLLMQCGD